MSSVTPDDVRARLRAAPHPLPPPPAWLRPERLPDGVPLERPVFLTPGDRESFPDQDQTGVRDAPGEEQAWFES